MDLLNDKILLDFSLVLLTKNNTRLSNVFHNRLLNSCFKHFEIVLKIKTVFFKALLIQLEIEIGLQRQIHLKTIIILLIADNSQFLKYNSVIVVEETVFKMHTPIVQALKTLNFKPLLLSIFLVIQPKYRIILNNNLKKPSLEIKIPLQSFSFFINLIFSDSLLIILETDW